MYYCLHAAYSDVRMITSKDVTLAIKSPYSS